MGKGSPKGQKGQTPFDLVPKDKWSRAYKDESAADGTALCWFHNNRPGGCSGGYNGKCSWSHEKRPADYGGKAWEYLDPSQKAAITAKVEKA